MCVQNPRRLHSIVILLFTGLALIIFNDAVGKSLCVTTSSEFQAALTAMSDNGAFAGQANEINMASGHYKIGNATAHGPFKYRSTQSTSQLTIEGGFNANCTTFTADASLTVLDGLTTSQVLQGVTDANLLEIFFLTIQGGSSTANGGGLSVNVAGSPGADDYVDIADVIFKDNKSAGKGAGFYIASGGTSSITNSLVVNNSAQGDFGGGVLSTPAGCAFQNNTVSANTTAVSNGTGGVNFDCDSAYLYDNILWGNTNYAGDFTHPSSALLVENDYGNFKVTPSMNQRFQTVDPKFVDPDHGDFHLAGNSPLLARDYSAKSRDLQGHSPSNAGAGDLGAYQTTIFTSDFEVLPPNLD